MGGGECSFTCCTAIFDPYTTVAFLREVALADLCGEVSPPLLSHWGAASLPSLDRGTEF